MDASVSARPTDRLGRPTGPRRKHSGAEKAKILAEIRVPGASVAEVARRHGINANLVFGWRRLERRGLLPSEAPQASLLPVRVETPTVTPTLRMARVGRSPKRAAHARGAGRQASGIIEVVLGEDRRLRLHGDIDIALLEQLIELLERPR